MNQPIRFWQPFGDIILLRPGHAVPCAERGLHHRELDPSLRSNLTFTYYPSGHMVYLNPVARKEFRADLEKFYDSAASQ